MRFGWPECALLAAFGPCIGCGAKSALSETSFDPIGPQAVSEAGALPNPNAPDGMGPTPLRPPPVGPPPPKPPPPRPAPKPRDAATWETGAGGARSDGGARDAEVPPSDASVPPEPPPGPIAIGVVKTSEDSAITCLQRFVDVLGTDASVVESIDPAADYGTFHSHDLIVACSNWAENGSTLILGRSELYTRYVQEGGGLLMFQPNPYPLPSLRIPLLPEWFEVANFYDEQDIVTIVDPTHPVTQGLADGDMPFPADRITGFSSAWTELSRGSVSGDASLIVVDIGRGRAAVDGAHHVQGIVKADNNNSDALVRRLSLWLTHRL